MSNAIETVAVLVDPTIHMLEPLVLKASGLLEEAEDSLCHTDLFAVVKNLWFIHINRRGFGQLAEKKRVVIEIHIHTHGDGANVLTTIGLRGDELRRIHIFPSEFFEEGRDLTTALAKISEISTQLLALEQKGN